MFYSPPPLPHTSQKKTLLYCYNKVSVEKIAVEFFSGFSLFHAQAGREIKLFYTTREKRFMVVTGLKSE